MSVQHVTITDADAGQRLDRWLRRTFPQLKQSRIERMCRKGELRLDGGRVKPSSRVEAGQNLRIPPIPVEDAPRPVPAKISDADAEMIRRAVIYRDDHVLALNKPAGLAVQGGSKQTRHVDALSEALKFGASEAPRLVHRLDKDTSGVLLMARSRKVATDLTAAFRHRDTRKIYWAVLAGVPSPRMGTIRFGLMKAPGHGAKGEGEKMVCLHPNEVARHKDAKHATSDYAVIENAGPRATWAALVPVTGRTHQLRAHMAEIGHPIVGDGKYGGRSQENLGDGWGAGMGEEIGRQLHLHARSLRVRHPVTGADLVLTAPLPDHMQHSFDFFQWDGAQAPADPFEDLT